jgi:hypothetical protein
VNNVNVLNKKFRRKMRAHRVLCNDNSNRGVARRAQNTAKIKDAVVAKSRRNSRRIRMRDAAGITTATPRVAGQLGQGTTGCGDDARNQEAFRGRANYLLHG